MNDRSVPGTLLCFQQKLSPPCGLPAQPKFLPDSRLSRLFPSCQPQTFRKENIMYIFTLYQYEKLLQNGSPEERGKDHAPVVKLFLPGSGCTWLLTELDPEEPTFAFGLCDLGMGFPELGYVDLDEIMEVKNKLGLRIERDFSFSGKFPISVYARAALANDCIIEDETIVAKYVPKVQPKYEA